MKKLHPVFFHVSGHAIDLLVPITLQRALYFGNRIFYHSGVDRQFVWGGIDGASFSGIDTSVPANPPDEHAFHVWIIPRPQNDPRERGGSFVTLADGSSGMSCWLPRIVGDGWEGWYLVHILPHEFAHDRGVAVSPTTEVYELEAYPWIWTQWEACLQRSPMNGPAWVEGFTYEQMAARNIFGPHEAAILNGNYRGTGNAPKPRDGWPEITIGNPEIISGSESVFRSQAARMGFPARQTVSEPTDTLTPYPEPPKPPVDSPTSWDVKESGKDWLIYGHGCEAGKTYVLKYGEKELSWQTAYEAEIGFITRRGPGRGQKQKFTVEEVKV